MASPTSSRGPQARLRRLAPLALLLLSCSAPPPRAASERAPADDPHASLAYQRPPEGGAAYRLRIDVEGEREVGSLEQVRRTPESWRLELDYRELPDGAEGPTGSETVLVLDALRYEARSVAGGQSVELAEDRLRVLRDGEVELDLEGAHPREALTPRMLLDRPFAGLRYDAAGNPLAIVVAGPATARDFLRGLPLRASLAWTRLAFPEPGGAPASWRALRVPVGPSARLGLALQLHHEVVGVEDGGLVRVRVWGDLHGADRPSEGGLRFDRVQASVRGGARIALDGSLVRCLRLEGDVRVSYRTGSGPTLREHRLRHQSRASLELRAPDATGACADLEPRTLTSAGSRAGRSRP